ncbi:MAG: tetratricopeptide repeat protein [Burkholderiales bacterium]|nr:tetratricopeptide repeat protein [Burkholderiales bacterium]
MAAAAFLAALTLALAAPAAAQAQSPQALLEADRLLRQGSHTEALALVEARIAVDPRDAQARFLKGVILAEQDRPDEAIDTFVRLIQEHPERAEPYNNLAVLYAARGGLDRARELLETAVRVNPKFATAQENLGDVYARLAAEAYARAAELDARAVVRTKLRLARELAAGAAARPAARATSD